MFHACSSCRQPSSSCLNSRSSLRDKAALASKEDDDVVSPVVVLMAAAAEPALTMLVWALAASSSAAEDEGNNIGKAWPFFISFLFILSFSYLWCH
jgi:hypothetical protein